jgi:serine/threonine-protein kinase
LAAHLQGAAIARALYSDTRNTDYLERAEKLLARARELAPRDPRPLFLTFRIALDRGERQVAEAALARLIEVAPNDVNVPIGRSSLAERDGNLEAAVAEMRSVVERVPSWQNLHHLAELELRRGDVDDARRHLEQLIALVPANTWGLAKLARLELFYGDLESAASLYSRVIKLKPHRSYFTNLGLARFMLGHYREAKESYLQALEMQPDHLFVRLNLADTEMALGEKESALTRYRLILEELEQRELDATESMTMAQCLAHLGESQRAVSVTLDMLQRNPEDLQVVYTAALVYALAGDVSSALVNTENALAKGYQPRWFMIPDFDVLKADPRFRALLDRALLEKDPGPAPGHS